MHFFVVYGIIKVKLLKIFGGNTEKFFGNLLTNRERSAILCTEKPRTKLKFGYFSLGSTV